MAILTRMYQRRGTQAQWNAVANTVILQSGEIGLEHDTGRFKLGDGSSVWSNLPYYLPDNNPAASGIRQGKNAHDIYSKLSPLAPSYTQTFTGAQVLVPQNNAQTPLVVSGLSGQSAVLQRWRDSLDTTLASIDANGKLLAKGGAQFDANVNVNANKIINLAAPTNPQDATNKQYVDDAIAGLIWKSPVNLVSASGLDTFINVPLTGNTNTLILDGHAALDSTDTGYRILLVAQTTATENGIYVYNDNGTTYTLTRAVDADTYQELNSASVFVNEGTHYGTSSWVQTNHYLTSFADQDWVQFNGASQIVADGGLTKVGNTLAVGGTTDRIKINTDSVDISENYAGQTSITTLGTIGTGTWNATTIAANKGGTGQSSYAIGDILYASSTSALSKLSPGTSGYPLISGGTGNGPSYAQVNTAGIADDSVTYDKIQNISAQHRILGRASAGAGNAEELTPDQLMTTINQGNTGISFNLLPVGTTSTTVSQGDHTHTLDDLSDVVISGAPVARQVIKYDGTKWVNELPSGGISIGASAPTGASAGDAWFDSTDGSLYVYYDDFSGSPSAQWVQVKANSALEASILTRLSAVEARDTKLEAANAVRVSSQSERTSVYPSPVQGNTVFRADLGYEEKYYAAYNATTNPDGTTGTPGWYEYRGGAPLSENKIINGGFDVWQRGTTFNFSGASGQYTTDRFAFYTDGTSAAVTVSQQTFTPGTAPVASTEARFFVRINRTSAGTGGTYSNFQQAIEDVRSFAGQTVSLSFWAKADSSRTVTAFMNQDFGTGGSSSVPTTSQSFSVTTSWQKFTATFTLPGVSGKTISSTDSKLWTYISTPNVVSYIDIWGVQVEQGPVATPFRRNQPNIQAELAACQRYYWRTTNTGAGTLFARGHSLTTNRIPMFVNLPVTMRVPPTAVEWTGVAADYTVYGDIVSNVNLSNILIWTAAGTKASNNLVPLAIETVSITSRESYSLWSSGTSAYLGFSAEL